MDPSNNDAYVADGEEFGSKHRLTVFDRNGRFPSAVAALYHAMLLASWALILPPLIIAVVITMFDSWQQGRKLHVDWRSVTSIGSVAGKHRIVVRLEAM